MTWTRTLLPVDGPRAGEARRVRTDGSTMADLQLPDGSWALYDNVGGVGRVDAVVWSELGDGAGTDSDPALVTEVDRRGVPGVL